MGSSGGGGGGQSPYTEQQKQLLWGLTQMLMPEVMGKQGYTYGGELIPDWSAFEKKFQNWATNYGTTPADVTRQGALAQALSGKPGWDVSPERYTRDFDVMVRDPAMIGYQDTIRQIEHRYGSMGDNGPLLQAALDTGRDFETTMLGERAKFGLEGERAMDVAYNAAADRAAGALPFALEDRLTAGRIYDYAGQMEYQRAVAQNQEDFLKWQMQFENPYLTQYLGTALGVGPNLVAPASSQLADIGTAVGGGMTLAGALGQLA